MTHKNTVHFTAEQWEKVKETYENWWEKKADRVVVGGIIRSFPPSVEKPKTPYPTQWNLHNVCPASETVDAIEYELSQYEFLGDSFPFFNMDCFGPGVMAAFLGCDLFNHDGQTSIWFHPNKKYDILNCDFRYDKNNPVLLRIKEIYREATRRFEGRVIFGMPDLGGIADVLSSFFPGEELIYLLYDEPEEVKKQLRRLSELWQVYYDEFSADLKSETYGYCDWSGIYSKKPSYIIQSDFSYMIGNPMFEEFLLRDIELHSERLCRTVYHLDGVGELPHLDSLLGVKGLTGIQWVPGAQQPPCNEWMHIYRRILDADKLAQVFWSGYDALYEVAKRVEKKGYLEHQSPVFDREMREQVMRGIDRVKSLT